MIARQSGGLNCFPSRPFLKLNQPIRHYSKRRIAVRSIHGPTIPCSSSESQLGSSSNTLNSISAPSHRTCHLQILACPLRFHCQIPRRNLSTESFTPILEPLLSSTCALTTSLATTLGTVSQPAWYLALPLTAIILRTLTTLPISLYSRKISLKTASLTPLIQAWSSSISKAVRQSHQQEMDNQAKVTLDPVKAWLTETRSRIRNKRKEILKRHGCQTWKTYLPTLVQVPLWILVSTAIRGIVHSTTEETMPFLPPFLQHIEAASKVNTAANVHPILSLLPSAPSLSTGGIFWFPNLLLPDPFYILPVSFSILLWLNAELSASQMKSAAQSSDYNPPNSEELLKSTTSSVQTTPNLSKILVTTQKAVALASLPLTINAPTALLLYWVSSVSYSLTQNLVMNKLFPVRIVRSLEDIRAAEGRGNEVVVVKPCKPKGPIIDIMREVERDREEMTKMKREREARGNT